MSLFHSLLSAGNNKGYAYALTGQSNANSTVLAEFAALMEPLAPGRIYTYNTGVSGATQLGQGGVNDWMVSEATNGHYATFSAQIIAGLAAIAATGKTPVWRGWIHRQGEAEGGAAVSGLTSAQVEAAWLLQFSRLIKYVIDDVNEAGYDTSDVRIVVQRIHATLTTTSVTNRTAVRSAQDSMANFLTTYTGYANLIKSIVVQDTDGFSYGGDGVHYTATGTTQSATACYNYLSQYINEVNTPSVIDTSGFDADAVAFLTANQCRSQAQADALNTFVLALKSASIYTKFVALWPTMGGHRVAHKYNLINPLNTNGAYRLTHNKGWDHTDDGFYGDAIAGYVETHVAYSTLGQNTAGLCLYSMTSGQEARYGMGVLASGNLSRMYWGLRWTDNLNYVSNMSGEQTGLTNTDGSGTFIMSRTSSSNFNTYIRGTKRSYSVSSVAPDSNTFTIGARNLNGTKGSFSARTWALFGLLNSSLSDADELALRNAINTFQTAIR